MKNKITLVVSLIIVVSAIVGVCIYNIDDSDTSIQEYMSTGYEDLYDYTKDVPDDISSASAWKSFIDSEYYDKDTEYVFKMADDRVVCEAYYDDYYVYMEFVFERLTIDIIDINTMHTIIRFE